MNGMWAMRPIEGAMGTIGPRKIWMSEVREIVGGVPLTPFTRVAISADFASPFANAGDQGCATSTATSRSICIACPSPSGSATR